MWRWSCNTHGQLGVGQVKLLVYASLSCGHSRLPSALQALKLGVGQFTNCRSSLLL